MPCGIFYFEPAARNTLAKCTGTAFFAFLAAAVAWTGQLSLTNKPYPINDVPLFYRNNIRLLILLFIFALAQIPLLINLIKGIVKNVKRPTSTQSEGDPPLGVTKKP